MMRLSGACTLALILVVPFPHRLAAQVAPDDHWRTINTAHFHVDFPRELEPLARRAAGEAERAWARLSAELTPPRAPIDLVVSDNQDESNGEALYFPTNRIYIWAHPPIDAASLRFGDDWIEQVVTHELTHVFHLDRSRGIWRLAQYVFGRHPSLFPNARSPRWLMEGLAVESESRLGSGGRLNGSELYATLDAVASQHPSLANPGRLSLAAPYFPGGNLAYYGGASLVDEAARAGGDSGVRQFIERTAVFPIPYMWDWAAERAFHASFGALAAREQRRPVSDTSPAVSPPYWDARAPRWRGDTVLFTANSARETPGLYAEHGGEIARVARRNNTDAFGIAGGQLVYAQLDFTDPYRLYSALYINGARVGDGLRLESPDVRADGEIVAVHPAGGAANLAVLGAGGHGARMLGAASSDTQWSGPRWSRRGDRIAAMRWTRGGESAVVVLDTLGAVLMSFGEARAVQSHPSWDVHDRSIYFTSDRSGRSAVYRVSVAGADSGVVWLVAESAAGLYDGEVSPDGRRLAAFRLSSEGLSLIDVPAPELALTTIAVSGSPVFAPGRGDSIVTAAGAAHAYVPLRTLVPRYWIPTLGTSARGNNLLGLYTSSADVVGAHSLAFDGAWDRKSGEFYGDADWTYHGLGQPVIDAAVSQGWSMFPVSNDANERVGVVARRNRVASITFSASRARVRSNTFIALAPQLEWRDFRADPDSLKTQIDPPLPATLRYPSVVVSTGWNNLSLSSLALGPEDGIALAASVRERWRADAPRATRAASVIGVASAYAPLPFGGYARSVLALHGAVGWAEPRATSLFGIGGVSGTTLELVPGYSIGDAAKAFFVRGFPAGAIEGIHAWGATAELRAPLPRIGRGLWPLPLYFQRTGLTVFGDAASAWCPGSSGATPVCPADAPPHTTLASVGAELLMDIALEYDTPTRFRVGIAAPVHGREAARASRANVFFSLGLPF